MEDVAGVGLAPVVHDQSILLSETRLAAEVGLGRALAVGLILPVRIVDTGIRYLDADARSVELATPNIHHRDETLTGIGDPSLTLRAGRWLGPWSLDGSLGLTLPLGRTEENPFRLGDMGLAHEHIQMGTGTVNPVAQVAVGRLLFGAHVSLWALTQQTLYENGKGYQAGDRYGVGLALQRTLPRGFAIMLGADARFETAERWDGVLEEDEGNQGRVDVHGALGVSWRANERLALRAEALVPLYTHVVGGQLSYPVIATVGVSVRFGGEHGKEERGPEPVDPDPGPQAGTITVIDYWATWCEPCKELDARLKALPARFVVRRVDMTDAHFHFTLPRIKIYGADGRLLVDRSGAPEELARAVEDVIK